MIEPALAINAWDEVKDWRLSERLTFATVIECGGSCQSS